MKLQNGFAQRWEDKIFRTYFLSGNTGKVKFLADKNLPVSEQEDKIPDLKLLPLFFCWLNPAKQ